MCECMNSYGPTTRRIDGAYITHVMHCNGAHACALGCRALNNKTMYAAAITSLPALHPSPPPLSLVAIHDKVCPSMHACMQSYTISTNGTHVTAAMPSACVSHSGWAKTRSITARCTQHEHAAN